MSQLDENYDFISGKNRLNPFLLVGSNLASRTAVTIFAHSFQTLLPFTCEILQDVRTGLCGVRCLMKQVTNFLVHNVAQPQTTGMCKAHELMPASDP